ncbi:MAG: hypothetical protein GY754_32385 [bacterium]|nr:hypothetical protein [bacterium]
MNHTDLPTLQELLGNDEHRLQGISRWDQIEIIGKKNIENIIHFARVNVNFQMTRGTSRDELSSLSQGIRYLSEKVDAALSKPLFPRLRNESFREDERVVVFAADTPNSLPETDWISGRVSAIEKSHKPEFDDGSPNAGFFWRVTVTFEEEVFPGNAALSFSTTEPRCIPTIEFDYLRESQEKDHQFVEMYSKNAHRKWHPIWCLERDLESAGESMDMYSWLHKGTSI